MNTSFSAQVMAFHMAVDHPVATVPKVPRSERCKLREDFIISEFVELMYAMRGIKADDPVVALGKVTMRNLLDAITLPEGPPNIEEVARQIADLHYVLSGTSLEFGIPENEVFREVHLANMKKAGGPKREDDKQLPPEGWEPPDVQGVLDAARLRTA
jgi:predicted HAD superfamily Cof-like phosphohydrolase